MHVMQATTSLLLPPSDLPQATCMTVEPISSNTLVGYVVEWLELAL